MKRTAQTEIVCGQIIATDQVHLAYQLCLPAEPKSLILLIHGLGLDGSFYEWFGKTLAQQGHLVCLPDLRGHGRSGGPRGDVSYIGQHTDDLLALLTHLHATYPALPLLIGAHSAGNSLLLRLLAQCQLTLAGTFLLAPVFNGYARFSRRQDLTDRLAYRLSNLSAPPVWEKPVRDGQVLVDVKLHLANCLLATTFPNWLGGLHALTSTRSLAVNTSATSNDANTPQVQHFSYRHFASLCCPNLERTLAGIRVPVFLAIGENDQFTFPRAALSLFRWSLPPQTPRQLLEVKRCGHFSLMTIAGLLVNRWLAERLPVPLENTP